MRRETCPAMRSLSTFASPEQDDPERLDLFRGATSVGSWQNLRVETATSTRWPAPPKQPLLCACAASRPHFGHGGRVSDSMSARAVRGVR